MQIRENFAYFRISDTRPIKEGKQVKKWEPGNKSPIKFSDQFTLVYPRSVNVIVI